ncbi:MAG: hypothetical protein QM503_09720 [Bacteroidota bacterium]
MNHKKIIAFVITISVIVFNSVAYAQIYENKCDTVKIVAPAYLVLNDTSIHLYRDTTAIICDKYIVLTKNNGYSLYTKLLGESQKHHLVDQLFQMLIASSTQDTMLLKNAVMEAEDAYTPYTGKIIRDIRIQVLDPFGATISDTNLPVFSTWGKAINKSHINTRKFIIERKLLFKVYDTINPFELVENTRELSGLPYLQDATIIVTNVDSDSVDVLVLAKDKFPWLPAANVYNINRMSFYLKNVNMLGMGQSLGAGLTMDTKSSPVVYVSDINYYVDNIYKQITGAVNYHVSDNDKVYQILLNRNVIPLSVRLGGGLELTQTEQNIIIDPTDINKSSWFFKFNYYELWSTYLFYKKDKLNNKKTTHTYIIPGVAVYKRNYLYRPFVSVDSNSMYNNYTTVLSNIALAKQDYYRINYLTNFGQAEYLPYGFQISVTGGYSWTEFMKLPYIGFRVAGVKRVVNFGYMFADFNIGSHFSDQFKQGAINMNLSYLSNLHKRDRYRYRLFATLNYTEGINRITNDLLYLGEQYGFIGMNEKAWYGQQRAFFEMDLITYTPWYFLGFRFAVFTFGSLGLIGDDHQSIFHNQILGSIGAGMYVKNDFLAFNSFQFRLAYFPVTPSGISHFGVSFSTIGLIQPLSLLLTKPHVVDYY